MHACRDVAYDAECAGVISYRHCCHQVKLNGSAQGVGRLLRFRFFGMDWIFRVDRPIPGRRRAHYTIIAALGLLVLVLAALDLVLVRQEVV